jgi:hypothetical protein
MELKLAMVVRDDMKVCSKFRWALRSVHDDLNYLRLKLIKVKKCNYHGQF